MPANKKFFAHNANFYVNIMLFFVINYYFCGVLNIKKWFLCIKVL